MKNQRILRFVAVGGCAIAAAIIVVSSVQVAAQVPNGHPLIVRGPALIEGANPKQIALLRTYAVREFGANFQVGTAPGGIAFDGENMWIANYTDRTLSVLNAATGKVVGTYSVTGNPEGIAFDGHHMWVSNNGGNSVSFINTNTHVVDTTITGLSIPFGAAFDGTNMWVVNRGRTTASVFRASDAVLQMTPTVGADGIDIAFDGAKMWITLNNVGYVAKR